MFVLSKLFWLAMQPLSLTFLLLFLGFLAILLMWRRLGLGLLATAGVVLFVTLFTTAGAVGLQRLEMRFPRPSGDPASLSCMIVLGGAFEATAPATPSGIEFNQAAERFVEPLRLALAYPQSVIVVSGGDGSLTGGIEGDAAAAGRFFAAFGVDTSRLLKEADSRTTYENVRNLKALLDGSAYSDCLLITSAYHMPRSIGLFRKAGIPVTPWPVDYRTTGAVALGLDFTQPTTNAQLSTTAAKEWVGLAAYYLLGRTSELFAAP